MAIAGYIMLAERFEQGLSDRYLWYGIPLLMVGGVYLLVHDYEC